MSMMRERRRQVVTVSLKSPVPEGSTWLSRAETEESSHLVSIIRLESTSHHGASMGICDSIVRDGERNALLIFFERRRGRPYR